MDVVEGDLGYTIIGIDGATTFDDVDIIDFASCHCTGACKVWITIGRPRRKVDSAIADKIALTFDERLQRGRIDTSSRGEANTLIDALLTDGNGWRKLGQGSNHAEKENGESTEVDHGILSNKFELVGVCFELLLRYD